MKRRLVKQGSATLMISLPSKWIQANNLSKGDEIDLEEVESTLVVSQHGKSKKHSTKINLTNLTESSIRTSIVNAYRSGYDIIEIRFSSDKHYSILSKTIQDYLLGFDITKREKNLCVIENITEPSEDQFDIIFSKIFLNISTLIENTEERLRNKTKFSDYESVVHTIHKYDNFCRRIIVKKNLFGHKASLYWTFMSILIHAQRELYHLNRFLDKEKVTFTDFKYYEHLKKVFTLLQESYQEKNFNKLEQIHELEKEIIYKDFYHLIQKGRKENIALYHITVAIKEIYLASSPLIGILL